VLTPRVIIWLKLVLFILLILAAIGTFTGWALYVAEPKRDGDLDMPGLSKPVSVYYDAWGVPHIDAQNDLDAYRALGFIHAQERLFQMDILRRIGAGRLSEILGIESLETDQFFRSLGISQFARRYAQYLQTQVDEPHVKLIHAYQEGINHYIDQGGRPLEYSMLFTRPDYFTEEDIAHVMGYMAYSFAEAFKTDALTDQVRGKLGQRHAQDLVPGWPDNLPPRSAPQEAAAGEASTAWANPLLRQVSRVESTLPAGQFLGSNAWVVNSSRSHSKAPMLANDPHIGFAAPAVWFEAHIRTPEHEVYGHFLGGIPFPLLGQTRTHAWGLTMLMNDEIDFYRERVNPDNAEQVWVAGDGWQDLTIHEEVIKIRGREDRLLRLRSSQHGPIINDPVPQVGEPPTDPSPPVSLFWTFLDPANDSAKALYGLSRAQNMQEFEQAASYHTSPGLNLIYADTQDNIAMWAIGLIKRWPKSNDGFSLLNGSIADDAFRGYQPFASNPSVINPPKGYIFSANNPYAESNPRRRLPGYYAPTERSARLEELLDNGDIFDLSQFKAMQLDTLRPQALAMLHDALPLFNDQLLRADLRAPAARAAAILAEWDGSFGRDSVGASLFQRWQDHLLEALFADELEENFDVFRNTLMAEKSLFSLYWKPASPWWDNRQQPIMDGRQAAIEQAWIATIESLSEDLGIETQNWTWSRLAVLQHKHPLSDRLPFAGFLDSDLTPVDGGRESLNSMTFDGGGPMYHIKAGPSTRRLIDLADLNGTLSISPMGQSGYPLDPHYTDQAALYNEGRYRGQLFDWVAIKALPDQLVLEPARRQRP
jgi:penicillin amidase